MNEAAGVLVVGAPKHDNSSLGNSGKAWAYTGSGTSWSIDGTLEPASGVEAGEQFGYSVDTDGQWIIVGGPWDTQNGANAGAAYIFAPASAGGWEQKQKVIGADTGASDYFGISVALDNSLAVVGAYAYDGPGGTNDGAVYVLQLQGSTWAVGAATSAENPAYTDQFGIAVAVDGAWVGGGSNQDDNGASDAGSVYAIRRINASVQYLHPDHLGSPVAATDVFGDVVGTQNFYPFGEVRSGTGIFDTERGFTGQIADAGTGLNFYNARYYDTAPGKFISPDSIVPDPGNPAHYNKLVYVGNNPLGFTDPSGRTRCQSTDCHSDTPDRVVQTVNKNRAIPVVSGGDDSDLGETWAEAFVKLMNRAANSPFQGSDLPALVEVIADVLSPSVFGPAEIGRSLQGDGVDGLELAGGALSLVPLGKVSNVGGLVRGADEAGDLVNLASPSRTRHILDGEVLPNGRLSGGHRAGTGFSGKTEFPAS